MSPCPQCGAGGRHVWVMVPIGQDPPVFVGHACPECLHNWREEAKDDAGALALAGLQRIEEASS